MASGISALAPVAAPERGSAGTGKPPEKGGLESAVTTGAFRPADNRPRDTELFPNIAGRTAQAQARRKTNRIAEWSERLRGQGIIVALLALIGFNLAFTPHFISWQTFNVNLTQVCNIVIVGVGMTFNLSDTPCSPTASRTPRR